MFFFVSILFNTVYINLAYEYLQRLLVMHVLIIVNFRICFRVEGTVSRDFEGFFMISSHYSRIATRHGAYLFFYINLFLFVNFKFLSFAVDPCYGSTRSYFHSSVAESATWTMRNNLKWCERPQLFHEIRIVNTIARWPNFWPNNSKRH
jgi:hypothetical protein